MHTVRDFLILLQKKLYCFKVFFSHNTFYYFIIKRTISLQCKVKLFKMKIKESLPKKPVAALFFLIRYMVQDRGEDIPNCPWFMFKFI